MKLAEALILRADIQVSIEQIKDRLYNNTVVQEGDEPSESPEKLIVLLDGNLNQLSHLIMSINHTNNNTMFDGDMTLSDALAKRDVLKKKRDILYEIVQNASARVDRYSRSEIKKVSTIDIEKLIKQVDSISKEYRILDTKIQGKNWLVDLIEK